MDFCLLLKILIQIQAVNAVANVFIVMKEKQAPNLIGNKITMTSAQIISETVPSKTEDI